MHTDGTAPSHRLARDSAVVGAGTVLTRLLGFLRDILIAGALGAGPVADALLVALRLPNLFRRVLGEGGLNAPFVPLYLAIKAERGPAQALRFAGGATATLGVGLGLISGLAMLAAPWLVLGLASGFRDTPDTFALAEDYVRLSLPFIGFSALASLLAAVLNAERRFLSAALAPALFNIVLIGALVWSERIGSSPELNARHLAIGISLGGAAQLVMIALASLRGLPGLPRLRLEWTPELAAFFRLGVPTLAAAAISQFVLLVATQIASAQAGAVSWLYYADRVFQLPLGFVAVAIGVVLLPEIARREVMGDSAGRQAMIDRALAIGLALGLPAAGALLVLAEPIVAVLFERGRFGPLDREQTAAALAAFATGLPCAVIAKILAQVYFARQAPAKPLVAGAVSLVVAAVSGHALAGASPATGAAWGASLAFAAQGLILAGFLLADGLWRPSTALMRRLAGVIAATAIMLAVCAVMATWLRPLMIGEPSLTVRAATLGVICFGGLGLFLVAARQLGAFRLADIRDAG
jgi:putative peptidoglycan lipid II flippase